MRKLLALLLLTLLPGPVFAQKSNWFSTKAQQEFQKALTDASYFGVPRYTTVLLPTCNTANKGAVAFDTTAGGVVSCNGTVWLAGGGAAASITPGTTTVGSSTNCFAYADGTSVLRCGTTFVANDSGAGDGIVAARKSGSGATSFLGVSGTIASSNGIGAFLNFTTTGGTNILDALAVVLGTGTSTTSRTEATVSINNTTATGTSIYTTNGSYVGGNFGLSGVAQGTTTGSNIGVAGVALGGDVNVGGLFHANTDKSNATNIGLVSLASQTSGTPVVVAGYFGLRTTNTPTYISSVLQLDNVAVAVPLLVASDNTAALPTSAATATWAILDGAWPQVGNGVLTSATMAAETQARDSGAMIHSYTWTNAQVAALAGTAGDITVATLPAKTGVRNAYVIVTGAAVGPATVTVSCGDAIGGTPFINYVGVSDAKAAANTVYGDAVAERGTSIDVEFYYLPSYTATTLVTCHFISTGANLSTVTGSTGRVVLETFLIP